jgi:hypothetical protein
MRLWTPFADRCERCGRRRRRIYNPLKFAAGDRLLDASGNRILDASGNVMLDDGAGNGCCCGEQCNDSNLCEDYADSYSISTDLWACLTKVIGDCPPFLDFLTPPPWVGILQRWSTVESGHSPCIWRAWASSTECGEPDGPSSSRWYAQIRWSFNTSTSECVYFLEAGGISFVGGSQRQSNWRKIGGGPAGIYTWVASSAECASITSVEVS